MKRKIESPFRRLESGVVPESNVKDGPVLLLHVTLEAITTAEYWCPQSSFAEQVVVLEEQETTWPWVPDIVAV